MPVSVVCETAASVNAALRESLGSGGSCSAAAKQSSSATSSQDDSKMNGSSVSNADDIDSLHGKLVASAKRVLLSKIDYEEVTNYGQSVLESLKSKYIVLKPTTNNNSGLENGRNSPAATCNNNGANGDSAAGKCTCFFLFTFSPCFPPTNISFFLFLVNIYADIFFLIFLIYIFICHSIVLLYATDKRKQYQYK